MTKFWARAALDFIVLLASRAAAQTQRFPAFDPERIFILGGADLDGRLSPEDYRDFLRSSPRMGAAATIEPMFRRIDADRDGFVSLSGYRKSSPQRPRKRSRRAPPPPITPEQEGFFETEIRPVLATQCGKTGVRFVELVHGDCDQHRGPKAGHARNTRAVDRPIAGPLTDRRTRGLLDETLVICGGKFGRTPHGQNADGRDHNKGFSLWLAGGGTRPGSAHGQTDELGHEAVENPTHVHDLHATILHPLGLDHERLKYRCARRNMRLTDVKGVVHEAILE